MTESKTSPAAPVKQATEKSVLAYCAQAGLFPVLRGRRVCAAVSGGADSMALLRILCALAEELQMQLSAVHVNHGLRGATADRDEQFVRESCAVLGVPLTVFCAAAEEVPIPENAGEDWARQLRYAYFDRLLASGVDCIATAHTANDQAETVLFRLARGTGAHGAAGIAPLRGRFVRPLLGLTRAEVEAYCAACGQSYVTDETNLQLTYARNQIRHQVLPVLKQVNAGAVQNLCAFGEKMRRMDAYFTQKGAMLLQQAAAAAGGSAAGGPWQRSILAEAEPLVLESALHALVQPIRDPEEKYIRLLADCIANGGGVQLRDDVRFTVRGGILLRDDPAPPAAAPAVEYPLAPGEYTFPGGMQVKVQIFSRLEWENTRFVHKKDLKNVADYAKIAMSARLRTRRPGDRFHQAGRTGTKTLKKLYNAEGVAQRLRSCLPLAAEGDRVLWLWGHGFAEGLAPDASTKRLLLMQEQSQEEDK